MLATLSNPQMTARGIHGSHAVQDDWNTAYATATVMMTPRTWKTVNPRNSLSSASTCVGTSWVKGSLSGDIIFPTYCLLYCQLVRPLSPAPTPRPTPLRRGL